MTSPVIVGSILVGADDLVAEMVRSRIPHMQGQSFGPCTALGVIRRGILIGGVIYSEYRGFDIQMSCAFDKPGWALPDTLRAIFAYPFIDLGCRRVSALNGRRNKKARQMTERLGFTLVGVAKRGLDGFEDAFIWEMLKEDCKWIKEKANGQIIPDTTAAA